MKTLSVVKEHRSTQCENVCLASPAEALRVGGLLASSIVLGLVVVLCTDGAVVMGRVRLVVRDSGLPGGLMVLGTVSSTEPVVGDRL